MSARSFQISLVLATLLLVAFAQQPALAQIETVPHNFANNGTDGYFPVAGLVRDSKGNLYGTTQLGGATGATGTVFRVTSNGSESVLHSFDCGKGGLGPDGCNINSPLLLDSKGNLYGTASEGGTSGKGAVFEITAAGTELVLYSFTGGVDGNAPYGGLVQDSSGNLYGTTYQGGAHAAGNVFELTAGGSLTPLYSFTGGADGGFPFSGLVRDSAGNLYGTTDQGGTFGSGVAFKVTSNGTETVLHSFGGTGDGTNPDPALIRDPAGNLFGVTLGGGAHNAGTVFEIKPNGAYSVLYNFTGGTDGNEPVGSLVRDSGGNLYGMTNSGGTNGHGTLFEVTLTGTETVIFNFTSGSDSAGMNGSLVRDSAGNFYGTNSLGGSQSCFTNQGCGDVFKITIPSFTISASPKAATISTGQSTDATLTFKPVAGFNGTVTLTCTVPAGKGLSCGESPSSVIVSGSTSATLMVNTSSTTPAGTYKVDAKGASGELTHAVTFTLTVQ